MLRWVDLAEQVLDRYGMGCVRAGVRGIRCVDVWRYGMKHSRYGIYGYIRGYV